MMSDTTSSDFDLDEFLTQEQQAAAIEEANAVRSRPKRPGQLVSGTRSSTGRSGRPRLHQQQDTFQQAAEEPCTDGNAPVNSQWASIQQQKQERWLQDRETNTQLCQQHHANHAADIADHAVAAALRAAAVATVAAMLRHPCCGVLDEGELDDLRQQLMDQIESQVQVRLATQQSAQAPEQLAQAPMRISSMRLVACHVMGASFWLPVPTVQCSCSHMLWEVKAAAAGFFGNSPVQPGVWFGTQLLDAYTIMAVDSGTSATSFASALSSVAHRPSDVPDLPRMATKLTIDDRHLRTAWMQWRHASASWRSASAVAAELGKQQQLGPAAACPACAAVPPESDAVPSSSSAGLTLDPHSALAALGADEDLINKAKEHGLLPGTVDLPITLDGKPVLQVACVDGNAKFNRYASAGRALGGDSSSSSSSDGRVFLGPPQERLWDLNAAGPLPISSSMDPGSGTNSSGGSGSPAVDDEAEVDSCDQCHPQLSCARDTSLASGISDECGVAGAVCSHGQPLRGGMLAMPAPERFLYYDLLLSYLQTQAHVKLLYLDTGCRYASHVRLHMPPEAGATLIKVPWWHARGHGASCYVQNSGFYLPGSGRRVGETCEQTWALLLPTTKLTRYMSKTNYLDCLDDALLVISDDKLGSIVTFFVSQPSAVVKKLGEARGRIKALLEAAARQQVQGPDLMRAALATMDSSADAQAQLAAEEKMLVDYVRCNEQLRGLHAMQQNHTSFAVALPGSGSRSLQARAQDSKRVERLQRRLAGLMCDLGLDEQLEVTSSQYKQGLAAVRDEELVKAQRDIEREVALLGSTIQQRQQSGPASQLTRNRDKKIQRRRTRIRQLVDGMVAWQQHDLPPSPTSQCLPEQWSQQTIRDLEKGTFPWRQHGGAVALLAEQFRDACAEEARTLEELQMQHIERRRIVRYFQFMHRRSCEVAADVEAQHSRLAAEVAEQLRDIAPEDQAVCSAVVAQQHMQRTDMEVAWAQWKIYTDWAQYFKDLAQAATEQFHRIEQT